MQLLLIEIAGCLGLQCMGAVAASIYVGVKKYKFLPLIR